MSQFAANNLTLNDRDIIARAGQIKLSLAAGCTGLENDPAQSMRLHNFFKTVDVRPAALEAARKTLVQDILPNMGVAAAISYHAWVMHSLYIREWLNYHEQNGFHGRPEYAKDAYAQSLRWEKNASELATYALDSFENAVRTTPQLSSGNAAHTLAQIKGQLARTQNLLRRRVVTFDDAKPALFSSARFTYLTTAFAFSTKTFALYLGYCERELGILHGHTKAYGGMKLDATDVAQHLSKHIARISAIQDERADAYQAILLLAQSAGQDPRTIFFGGVTANEPGTDHLRYKQ